MDNVDRSNLDDASGYYGLGHHAEKSEGRGSGGIAKHFERESEERKAREKAIEKDRRDLERRVREHNAEVDRTGIGERWAVPAELPSNAEAYEAIEKLTREIQRERGLSFLEASQAAREQIEARGEERSKRDADAEYLGGVSVESLMKYEGEVKGGSHSGGRLKHHKKGARGPDPTEGVILASYIHTIEPEARDAVFKGRMSPSTAKAICKFQEQTGVNVAGIVAAIAQLSQSSDPNAQLALRQLISHVPVRAARKAS